MTDEETAGGAEQGDGGRESGPAGADDDRRHRVERRTTIDLTRAERGEPERRRLPGVDRRDNPDTQDR